jgi:hypothetical protein
MSATIDAGTDASRRPRELAPVAWLPVVGIAARPWAEIWSDSQHYD